MDVWVNQWNTCRIHSPSKQILHFPPNFHSFSFQFYFEGTHSFSSKHNPVKSYIHEVVVRTSLTLSNARTNWKESQLQRRSQKSVTLLIKISLRQRAGAAPDPAGVGSNPRIDLFVFSLAKTNSPEKIHQSARLHQFSARISVWSEDLSKALEAPFTWRRSKVETQNLWSIMGVCLHDNRAGKPEKNNFLKRIGFHVHLGCKHYFNDVIKKKKEQLKYPEVV